MRLLLYVLAVCSVLQGCAGPAVRVANGSVSAECAEPRPRASEGKYSLTLSGGGYRAMLFHVGAIWRLHELGILDEVRVVSSVSGGSIAAGVLAAAYERIRNDVPGMSDCYRELVATPALSFAQRTIDWKAASISLVAPTSPGNVLASFYESELFGPLKLRELPNHPNFLFQATNLHTGSVWTFSRNSIGDPQVGAARPQDLSLSDAIAASSAFPPILSPYKLAAAQFAWVDEQIDPAAMQSREYRQRQEGRASGAQSARADTAFARSLRSSSILLTDGGVADNLGLEGIWETRDTVLVSDGGSETRAQASPPTGWIGQLAHVTGLIHTQPTQLRYHLLLEGFRSTATGGKDGAYWAISKNMPSHREDCYARSPKVSETTRAELAAIPTRLSALLNLDGKRLVNLGYHVADWHIPYLNARMAQRIHSISTRLPYREA